MAEELRTVCDRISKLELLFKQLSEWVHFQPPNHKENGIASGCSNCDTNKDIALHKDNSSIENDSYSIQSKDEENFVIKMELAEDDDELDLDPKFTPSEDYSQDDGQSEKYEFVSETVDSVKCNPLEEELQQIEYQCKYCEDIFKLPSTLAWHLKKRHSAEKDFVLQLPERKSCYFCKKVFSFTSCRNLEEHVSVHTGEKPFKCPFCNHETRRERHLQDHCLTQHGVKPKLNKNRIHKAEKSKQQKEKNDKKQITCVVQGNQSMIEKKEKRNGKSLRLNCEYCKLSFPTPRGLGIHRTRRHKHESNFKKIQFLCKYCGKSFHKNWVLENHLTKHTKEKRFLCSICGKGFGIKMVLRDHLINMHGNLSDKKYGCYLCPMRFNSRRYLETHTRRHTGERPFQCEKCDYSAVAKQTLRKHMIRCSRLKNYKIQ